MSIEIKKAGDFYAVCNIDNEEEDLSFDDISKIILTLDEIKELRDKLNEMELE
jgi:hypothetical protein